MATGNQAFKDDFTALGQSHLCHPREAALRGVIWGTVFAIRRFWVQIPTPPLLEAV